MTLAPDRLLGQPEIDPDAIAAYAEMVFGYVDGFVAVRILTEKGTPDTPPMTQFHRADATLGTALVAAARKADKLGKALYVVPVTVRSPGKAAADDLFQTSVILIDLDQGPIQAKRDHLVRALGEPSGEIASGGLTEDGEPKLHLYWRLTEAAEGDDLDLVRDLRETIAVLSGGDSSFDRLTQPIRVAGSIHAKYGRRSPVRIVAHRSLEYDLHELADRVRSMSQWMPAATNGTFTIDHGGRRTPSAHDLLGMVVRENAADGITRYSAISKVAGHFIREARMGGVPAEVAWKQLQLYNTNNISPPWPERRLRREFDAILVLDQKNYPSASTGGQAAEVGSTGPLPAPPLGSDDALAAAFVREHGRDWLFVPAWCRWLHWAGMHWAEDETLLVREVIRQVCRRGASAGTPAEARRLASARTIGAVERILSSDPEIAVSVGSLDADPWLLNCTGGILDLRTGELVEHHREALITRLSPARPEGRCPRWLKFIEEITGGDGELADYLQRLAGYCLTGMNSEQIFAFFHGSGANGKSVYLQVLQHVLGDYAMIAALDTFMASQGDRHSTDLAGLRGARLVVVTETEPGRTWAESRIKAITGGDRLRARYVYRDNFEFQPTFKLIVAGNHRPGLANIGESMRRRLHLVPFAVTIPPENRDKALADVLKNEADGILAWMIRGCAAWQEIGLAPPEAVLAAGQGYFADEDLVGQWIGERCTTGPGCQATSAALYLSWKDFAEIAGHPAGSQKALGAALRERGFSQGTVGRVRGWSGIAVRPAGGGG